MTTSNGKSNNSIEEKEAVKFGTFGGVFTPSILTILGVIMYLRLGWVVGSVGLIGSLIIITLASAITVLTSLSISSIATDQKVRGGGAYYMISRSLGVEGGGAVGIPLYIAQAFSVPLYTIGFAESVALAFPGADQRTVGIIVTLFVAALAIKSARIAIKAQYFIMAAIGASLLSLILGSPAGTASVEAVQSAVPAPAAVPGFWQVFAVFFPAVTGIMAGINMSGDLKDPAKSIPKGTLFAVGAGYLIYASLAVLLYTRSSPEELVSNPLIMYGMSRWGGLILMGIWGATLSSAIGSILGAPRVLQALARDNVLPRGFGWLGKGVGAAGEPRAATALTLAVALILVWVGDLNTIAPILTMFFLTTYLVLNMAAAIENFLKNPSFKPSFRIHWGISLLGAGGCIAAMFLINPGATVVAGLVVVSIYIWLESRGLERKWGDVRRGLWMMLIRAGLLQIDRAPDPRNWRPNILVLSGAPTRRWHLIQLSDMFTHRRGMFTVVTVLPYDSKDTEQKAGLERAVKEYLDKRGVPALVRLISAPDPFTGAGQLVEAYGLGPVVPNTIMLGDTEREEAEVRKKYFKLVGDIYHSGKNTIIFKNNPATPLENDFKLKKERNIDVWWGGLEGNGGLMLLLADSLRLDDEWRGSKLKVKLVVSDEAAREPARKSLHGLISAYNITDVEYEVIDSEERSFESIFRASSKNADIIFQGLPIPDDNFADNYDKIGKRMGSMPTSVMVLAGKGSNFSEVLEKE